MRNIRLIVSYDGSKYHGFQKQAGTGLRTIQEMLENALSTIAQEPINIIGSGRTDAGVHAQGQVVNFKSSIKIPQEKIALAVNALLPQDIVVWQAQEVDLDFNARFDAIRKTYRYTIYNERHMSPFWRYYAYHIPVYLDVKKMNEGAERFLGEHDFKGFCAKDTAVQNFVRTIYHCHFEKEGPFVVFTVKGNGFLYNMVRIMVGTLLDVGKGKVTPQEIKCLIEKKERKLAGATAPPHGLCLLSVDYD